MSQDGISRVAVFETSRTGSGFYDWHARSVDELRRERDVFLVKRMKFKCRGLPT